MIRVMMAGIFILSIFSFSCVNYDAGFTAKTVINADGTASRSGELKISLSGDRDASEDSIKALNYFTKHFVPVDNNSFEITQTSSDSAIIIAWTGELTAGETLNDYKHISDSGIVADNNIRFDQVNRWIYKDFIYEEIYSDPIDTTTIYPVLDSLLLHAADDIMKSAPLKNIHNPELAEELLNNFQGNLGRDLLRIFVSSPSAIDTLTGVFEAQIEVISDSIAGMGGVKENPQGLNEAIKEIYSSAWDSLYSQHPEVFGSYGIEINQDHSFKIEVEFPGCFIESNADTVIDNTALWEFDHYEFSGGEYKLELKTRKWNWLNVAIGLVGLLLIIGIILRPGRGRK